MIYYFLVYLFLEVFVTVEIASVIGPVLTFLEIIISALTGFAILFNFKNTFMQNLRMVSYNCIDWEEFQRLNLFSIIGAILLILPGFLSDMIGIAMQFPLVGAMVVNYFSVKSCKSNLNTKEDDVIDVEIISKHNSSK